MADSLFGDSTYLVDNSVFARARDTRVASLWRTGLGEDCLAACGPFVTEALYSARNAAELAQLLEELTVGMRYVVISESTWRLAYSAQLAMAGVAPQFHRRPPVDFLIAATAHEHRLGVLHYDRDYDLILDHTDLDYESRWAAEPGTLDEAPADALRPLRRGIATRLAQFSGDEAFAVHQEVITTLDRAIAAAGKPAPMPVSES